MPFHYIIGLPLGSLFEALSVWHEVAGRFQSKEIGKIEGTIYIFRCTTNLIKSNLSRSPIYLMSHAYSRQAYLNGKLQWDFGEL